LNVSQLSDLPYEEQISYHRTYNLNRLRHITFLDWATSGLFVDSQVNHFASLLQSELYGNTHSTSPSSERSSMVVDDLRNSILKFLGTDALKYTVIFTHSDSQALKTFIEAFPFNSSSSFLISSSSSNNILGLRHCARSKNANVALFELNDLPSGNRFPLNSTSVLAFPFVDAFDGTVLTAENINQVTKLDSVSEGTVYSVVDASRYLAFNRLNLTDWRFSVLTFGCDIVFGFPKLGVLVVHNSLIPDLRKPYFGGGTPIYVLPDQNIERLRMRSSERFEDGSLPFLTHAAVRPGFQIRSQLGDSNITDHILNITKILITRIRNLTNPDGSSVIKIYGHNSASIVGFNFIDSHGSPKSSPFFLSAERRGISPAVTPHPVRRPGGSRATRARRPPGRPHSRPAGKARRACVPPPAPFPEWVRACTSPRDGGRAVP
jgi:molybdenum cofactor sulfurtransferase